MECASLRRPTWSGARKAGGFDGLYTYSVGTAIGATFSRTCGEAHRVGLLCAPSVGPGYDARLATGDSLVRPRLDGATYDRMWRTAVGAHPDLVTITSYNEWQEGTQIEPAYVHIGHAAYDGAWGSGVAPLGARTLMQRAVDRTIRGHEAPGSETEGSSSGLLHRSPETSGSGEK